MHSEFGSVPECWFMDLKICIIDAMGINLSLRHYLCLLIEGMIMDMIMVNARMPKSV